MSSAKYLLCLFLFLISFFCSIAYGDRVKEVNARLQEEKLAFEQEQLVLSALQQRREDLQKEQESIKVELAELQEKISSSEKEIENLQAEQEVLTTTIEDLEAELDYRKGRFRQRLVSMYKLSHRAATLHYLIQSQSATDLLRRVHDLRFMVRYDREGLTRLENVITRLSKTRENIAMLESSKSDLAQELKKLQVNLSQRQERQAKVVEEVRTHEKKQKDVVLALQKSSAALERSLAELMGSKQIQPPSATEAGLIGLARLKGRIPYPISGKIIQGFGKQKHQKFSDLLLVKGIEFAATVGGSVRAISSGKVIYTDSLPGYSTVVIVDHGERYYSLYGKLEDVKVVVGQELQAGDVVATTSKQPPADGEGNFYFELRHKGVAIDPKPFFSSSASF